MRKSFCKGVIYGVILIVSLLSGACASTGPAGIAAGPEFDLFALQRASMADVAVQLGLNPEDKKSRINVKKNKTVWTYDELLIISGGTFSGVSSSVGYEFYFSDDDQLYFIKIVSYYTNSSGRAGKGSADKMRNLFKGMANSFSQQLNVDPEIRKITESMIRYTWKTDKKIMIESGVDDECENGIASYGVVTEIQFFKPE